MSNTEYPDHCISSECQRADLLKRVDELSDEIERLTADIEKAKFDARTAIDEMASAYAERLLKARADAIEECAMMTEAVLSTTLNEGDDGAYGDGFVSACEKIAAAIRALKTQGRADG